MSAPLALQKNQLLAERYRLLRRLGFGAIGEVWAARNETIGREVALKLVRPRARSFAGSLEAYEKGVRESGKLRHPCILELLDLLHVEGAPAVVIPLLDAEKLNAALVRRTKLDVGSSLRLVGELARALAYAHEQGVFHGRVAPANVLLHKDARGQITPILVDFGVARFVDPAHAPNVETATSLEMFGELAYLSPEQATFDRDVDGRSDVWALGVLLQHCLVGEAPFRARRLADLRAEHGKPTRPLTEIDPTVDPELAELCRLTLIRARTSRLSARDLANRIDAILRRVPGDWPELAPDLRLAQRLDAPLTPPTPAARVDASPKPPAAIATSVTTTPKPAPVAAAVAAITSTPQPGPALERSPAPPPVKPIAPVTMAAIAPSTPLAPIATPAPAPVRLATELDSFLVPVQPPPRPPHAPPPRVDATPRTEAASALPYVGPIFPATPVLAAPTAWAPVTPQPTAYGDFDPEEDWARAQRSGRRRRWLVVLVGMLALAAGITLLVVKQVQDAEPKAPPATTGEPLKLLPKPH
jgi:serine/threonine-protein kinase